jgi:hypothetical protein
LGDSPRILATFVQSSLEEMDKLDAAVGERVRAGLEPAVLEEIEKASSISWLPVELDVALTECFFEVAGSERATRAFREALTRSIERPLLRPFVEGALALFGRDPAKLLRWVPKVWSLLYRDCGEMTCPLTSAGAARLELSGLPACIVGSSCYLTGTAATISAFFDFLEIEGRVAVEGPRPATGCAAFEIRW